jgi:putative membrane protein
MQKVLIPIVAVANAALTFMPGAVWAQGQSDTDRYPYGPHLMWWGGGW